EMVAVLVSDGRHAEAIRLEELWNELQRHRPFSLLCAYQASTLTDGAPDSLVDDVADVHTRTLPDETYALNASPSEQLEAIAILQQKARRLEAEIAQRRRAEEELLEQARTIETINRV